MNAHDAGNGSHFPDRRLRVLFVPYWYPPREGQDSVSGSFVREHVMAASLHDDVRVLAFRTKDRSSGRYSMDSYFDEGVKTFEAAAPYDDSSALSRLNLKLNWLRSLLFSIRGWGRPDLIHCQDMSSFYAGRTARLMGIPYVVSTHWTGFMKHSVTPGMVRNFRKSLGRARIVLASNRDAEADLKEYGIEANVKWLPNSFDPDVFFMGDEPADKPWLLHVSGFSGQKCLPDIITAFARVLSIRPDAFLHFVGDGPDRSGIEHMAREKLKEGSFLFHGFLAKEKVADLMRSCRGFVFPSNAETFGCVLMEAMACGCPVVTTSAGGIPAVVRKDEGILVDVGDNDAITGGMISCLAGDHGLDLSTIASGIRDRFSRIAVGEILHDAHIEAVTSAGRQ
jgi:glycosyltransferase involved in cell wall biosynthesis